MVVTPIKSQRRDAGGGVSSDQGTWGPLQIATPVIVGGVLLLIFAAYLFWKRNPLDKPSYSYQQVRTNWANRMERMFIPRRMRMRVLHSSAPVTIDDSMHTASLVLDFRRARAYRSGSADSQTPLTTTNYNFDYPPIKSSPSSPPPLPAPQRPPARWWWLLASRPQEIKSAEPCSRWRVDDPDSSSSGHGNSNHEHSSHGHRPAETLEAVDENENEEIVDDVIGIGENFASVESTPMTQHFPEPARAVRGMSTVPEYPGTPPTRTPVPATSASVPQTAPGTPASSGTRGLPPSYDASQTQTRLASTDNSYQPHSGPLYPAPVRAMGYSSPRPFHGRELSSDSFLATQTPMVTPSMY